MEPPNSIKTILYDLDGTLRLNQPSGHRFFVDHAVSLGLGLSPDDQRRCGVWEHSYWAESADLLRDRAIYPTPEAFWTNYARLQLEALGCTAEQARGQAPEMSTYMKDCYHPQDELAPGTLTVLEQLRAAGFVLGVVSNREAPFADYLTALGLGGFVAFSLSGGEAGSKKPDKGIFEHALRLAGSCAAETIYVGDNYFADVIGARGAGIIPVLFDPEGLFEEPDCAVIRTHDALPALLDGRDAWPGNGK